MLPPPIVVARLFQENLADRGTPCALGSFAEFKGGWVANYRPAFPQFAQSGENSRILYSFALASCICCRVLPTQRNAWDGFSFEPKNRSKAAARLLNSSCIGDGGR